jgi:8-oxo-dGTP pyrophosphatase MutT (NUDIX family)
MRAMPISPFVAKLRKKIGTDSLFLPGVSGVVLNDRREILLVHSRETNRWMPIGGQIEPGEEPADAAVREVFEETGVHAKPIRLCGVFDGPVVTYANGDQVHYLTLVFLCREIGGKAHVHDEENSDVRYFPLDQLPEFDAHHQRCVELALAGKAEAFFRHGNA